MALSFLTTPCRAASAEHTQPSQCRKKKREKKTEEENEEGRGSFFSFSGEEKDFLQGVPRQAARRPPFTYRADVRVKGTSLQSRRDTRRRNQRKITFETFLGSRLSCRKRDTKFHIGSSRFRNAGMLFSSGRIIRAYRLSLSI